MLILDTFSNTCLNTGLIVMRYAIDLQLFVQFKKREKYPQRSVTFSKVPQVFFTFLNLYKCYQITQHIVPTCFQLQSISNSNSSRTVSNISFIYIWCTGTFFEIKQYAYSSRRLLLVIVSLRFATLKSNYCFIFFYCSKR